MTDTTTAALPPNFDDASLREAARTVRHPLTRALLVLTFTTGLVGAVSYLGTGRVFAANMTGNGVLAHRMKNRNPEHLAGALAIEVLLITIAAVVVAAITIHPNAASGGLVIAVLA